MGLFIDATTAYEQNTRNYTYRYMPHTQQTHASAYTLPLSFESKIALHCLTVCVSTSLKEIMFLPEILLQCEKAC